MSPCQTGSWSTKGPECYGLHTSVISLYESPILHNNYAVTGTSGILWTANKLTCLVINEVKITTSINLIYFINPLLQTLVELLNSVVVDHTNNILFTTE